MFAKREHLSGVVSRDLCCDRLRSLRKMFSVVIMFDHLYKDVRGRVCPADL